MRSSKSCTSWLISFICASDRKRCRGIFRRAEYLVHLPADPGNVLAVEQHMVGNDQVKGAVLKGGANGSHRRQRENGDRFAESALASRIIPSEMSGGKSDGDVFGEFFPVFRPQSAVAAAESRIRMPGNNGHCS